MSNSNKLHIQKYVRYLFFTCFILFVFNKLYFRHWVLNNSSSVILKHITLSIPNFFEAVIGSFLITGIFYQLKHHYTNKTKPFIIYFSAISLTAVYTITQELKLHHIGGNNTYDNNDLIATILGLLLSFVLLTTKGFTK